jgi:methyltransferase-like protein
MAELLPGSEFVGVDRSGRQIEQGQALMREAELTNVQLRHADLMTVDESWGSFDFIVCHGVYSWVPAAVQDKILAVMRDRLRPDGVGYVSYNVYPGWHLREMVRHMMRYHVRELTNPDTRVTQAKALLAFLGDNVADAQGPYGVALRKELELLQALPDIYFHHVAERLQAHRLDSVGETDLQTMLTGGLTATATETLERVAPDLFTREQYLDFVRNRQFRATVICREGVALRRHVVPGAAEPLSFEFCGHYGEGPVELAPGQEHVFIGPGDVEMATSAPITKAAFLLLRRAWPRALRVGEVFERAASLVAEAGLRVDPDDRSTLAADLLRCCFAGGVGVRSWVPPAAIELEERPRAGRVARAQARRGDFVASLHHRLVRLDRAQRQIVQRLDGQHDQAGLCEELTELVVQGLLELTLNDEPVREREAIGAPLAHVVEQTLRGMVGQALLLGDQR